MVIFFENLYYTR